MFHLAQLHHGYISTARRMRRKVEIDQKAKIVMISGVDIDELWKESKEDAPCKDKCFKFNIAAPGVRKYLYLVTKNNKKASEHVHMA